MTMAPAARKFAKEAAERSAKRIDNKTGRRDTKTVSGLDHRKTTQPLNTEDLGLVTEASLIFDKGRILYAGPTKGLPSEYAGVPRRSLQGASVFPGFVDCHTHLVFAGSRVSEFEQRNQGVSYEEISRAGGGILSTVNATREATFDHLVAMSQSRLDAFLRQGVTTVEVKSGYGLNKETEIKMLEVARALKGPMVVPTFLGAHALPPEHSSTVSYLSELKGVLDTIKDRGLCQRLDIFVEKGYFSAEQAGEYLSYGKSLGMDVTLHGDQFYSIGGLELAVKLGAKSVDHIVSSSSESLRSLAKSATVGVFLPAADFYLDMDYPKSREFIDFGGHFAIASDYNPGSSPNQNINFVGLLCRLKMKMTLPEVFSGWTVGGAQALGLLHEMGSLEVGKKANFFVSSTRWDEFFYDGQTQWAKGVWVDGQELTLAG